MTQSVFRLPVWFSPSLVAGMQRGIEKEGLRMQPDGYAAKTFHPAKLGSKLTHPYITTDYSENLLELITDPMPSIKQALDMLRDLHVLVHRSLENNELMWPLSMPCMSSDTDSDIPLADYGSSNIGKLKTLYRSGLGVRYGRKMQTIAGLHYNLSIGDDLFAAWHKAAGTGSFGDFKNDKYLALIRNFKRLTPLVLYLLGASPAVCGTFVSGRNHTLKPLGGTCSYHEPDGTSLRMGKLGYTNSVQENLDIRYNQLDEYIAGLQAAIGTPYADFERIGVDDADGNPIQINSHILQIENEYYSPIRPKQTTKAGETPTAALAARGIAYVEFRAIDLDPYSDIGIETSTACFLEVLALYCLLTDSPYLMPDEEKRLSQNIDTVVNYGRRQGITITTKTGEVCLHDWIVHHLSQMQVIADAFDAHHGSNDYRSALAMMQGKATNPEFTLSAQIIADSYRVGGTWALGKLLAQKHQAELLGHALSREDEAKFDAIAQQSLAKQAELEAADDIEFAQYLQAYR
ncbi:glutamate-cysteine ligase [Moraxella cuniculi DSM 21768]|uniref:Glutamate--cysteine ligase n=2 Tax=Moraxella cuniculi TaxID=34061 RepID=A0A1N7DTL5_9GAMM|nr:glutamate--cysteine ligase [Moraxella cuniculi]OOS07439.1 glutamate--cysteine ligase [Moraxella cuniculi]SIR79187.1 glutamate-cysteine ligase [Moraxella cuniculi DSM 21768]VEG12629.1 Glutamate--cysteine ligase [Moraxella cuniculi]